MSAGANRVPHRVVHVPPARITGPSRMWGYANAVLPSVQRAAATLAANQRMMDRFRQGGAGRGTMASHLHRLQPKILHHANTLAAQRQVRSSSPTPSVAGARMEAPRGAGAPPGGMAANLNRLHMRLGQDASRVAAQLRAGGAAGRPAGTASGARGRDHRPAAGRLGFGIPSDTDTPDSFVGAADGLRDVINDAGTRVVAQKLLDAQADGIAKLGSGLTRKLNDLATSGPSAPGTLKLDVRTGRILNRAVDSARERRANGFTGLDFEIMQLDAKGKPHIEGKAIDFARYAGQDLHFTEGEKTTAASARFYGDMLGVPQAGTPRFAEGPPPIDAGLPGDPLDLPITAPDRPPVDAKIKIGFLRNPRSDPAGAIADFKDKTKRKHYDPNPRRRDGTAGPSAPELKGGSDRPDVYFPRTDTPDRMPAKSIDAAIERIVNPQFRERMRELRKLDRNNMLRVLFPDAVNHLHVGLDDPPSPKARPGVPKPRQPPN